MSDKIGCKFSLVGTVAAIEVMVHPDKTLPRRFWRLVIDKWNSSFILMRPSCMMIKLTFCLKTHIADSADFRHFQILFLRRNGRWSMIKLKMNYISYCFHPKLMRCQLSLVFQIHGSRLWDDQFCCTSTFKQVWLIQNWTIIICLFLWVSEWNWSLVDHIQ